MGHDLSVPDLLMGLAPAASASCPRCGSSTRALANGRGRIDFCGRCGTLDVHTSEGIELLTLRSGELPRFRADLRDPRLPTRGRALL